MERSLRKVYFKTCKWRGCGRNSSLNMITAPCSKLYTTTLLSVFKEVFNDFFSIDDSAMFLLNKDSEFLIN